MAKVTQWLIIVSSPLVEDIFDSRGEKFWVKRTGSKQLEWGVLSKDLVTLSLLKSASTRLIGESKAGLHLEKVGVVEGRCFNRLGVCAKGKEAMHQYKPDFGADLHRCSISFRLHAFLDCLYSFFQPVFWIEHLIILSSRD